MVNYPSEEDAAFALRPRADTLPEIDTSIVVATCSRAHLLHRALDSLLAEAAAWPKPVEIVIVDDGSTDETPELLAQFKSTAAVPMVVVLGKRHGVAAARNLGAQSARGTWLASFDDDQIALEGWLSALRTLADETQASCIGGALELSLPAGKSVSALGPRVRRVLGEHLDGNTAKQSSFLPASNNVLIRRDLFKQMGGYDVSFTEGAEDADLFERIARQGHAIWFQPLARALHITPETRLHRSNLRWTSLRLGASDVRRLFRRGRFGLLRAAILRVAALLLRDFPQLSWTLLSKDERSTLDVLCSIWYTQGFLLALPAFFGQNPSSSPFLRSLNFRVRNGERKEPGVQLPSKS